MTEIFTIEPAPARAFYMLGVIGLFLLALLLLFGFFAYSGRATRFEVTPDGLSISRTVYGRHLGWTEMRPAEARIVDLEEERDLQPRLRTNGLGLPGYRLGWFQLRQGGRALLFVTDPRRVVAIPTNLGYTLLLSVRDAPTFVSALQRASPESVH